MKKEELKFAQMLCSRLCHDIITPVGAINSGLELLSDNPTQDNSDIIDLLNQSAVTASRRLSLCRFAFGHGAANSLSCLGQMRISLQDSIDPEKFRIDWDIEDNYLEDDPSLFNVAKILANFIISAIEAMPSGGALNIKASDGKLSLEASGPHVLMHSDLKHALQEGCSMENISPRTVTAYFMLLLAAEIGHKILLDDLEKGRVIFSLIRC